MKIITGHNVLHIAYADMYPIGKVYKIIMRLREVIKWQKTDWLEIIR